MKEKKLFLSVLIVLLCSEFLFAQYNYDTNSLNDFYEAKRILVSGEPDLLNIRLKNISVAFLTNDECKLLRNMIYAKYGYSFKNEKLDRYFSTYEWYSKNPNYNDNMLTETDKANVSLLSEYEKRNTNKSGLKIADVIGTWDEKKVYGEVSQISLKLSEDNSFIFSYGSKKGFPVNKLSGCFSIKGNCLEFSVKKILLLDKFVFIDDTEIDKSKYYKSDVGENFDWDFYYINIKKPINYSYMDMGGPVSSYVIAIEPEIKLSFIMDKSSITSSEKMLKLGNQTFYLEE